VEVHVITRHHPNLPQYEEIEGVPVHRLPNSKIKPLASASYTAAAIPLLRRLNPDILHAHSLTSPTTTALMGKRVLNIPTVITLHRTGYLGDIQRLQRRRFGEQRLKGIRDNADAFIMISKEVASELEQLGTPMDKCHFIPNGVNAEQYTPVNPTAKMRLRQLLGLPIDAQIVIFTGRLAPEKRVNHLVDVWHDIQQRYPNALLLLVGTGDEEPALRAAAGAGVHFAGKQENVIPFLQASDLFVLPSVAEGLSVAMLEAMSCGLPALVTQVGGAADVITTRSNGWLIPPDDVPALKDALMTLLGSPALRRSLGDCGRETVLVDYQLPVVTSKLKRVYEQVLK